MLKKLFIACLCVAGLRADYDLKVDVEFTVNTDNPEELTTHFFTLNYSVAIPEISTDGSWLVKADLLSSNWEIKDEDDEMTLDLEEFEPVKQIDFLLDKNWKLKRPNSSESPVFDLFLVQALNFFVTKEYEYRNAIDDDSDDFPTPSFSSTYHQAGKIDGKFCFDETVGLGNKAFLATLKRLKGDYKVLYGDGEKLSYEFTGNAEARLLFRSYFPHETFVIYEETSEIPALAKIKVVLREK